jgi:hypothetical protein
VIEYLGWTATAVFVCSYACKGAGALKRVQMIGALIWVVYGVAIQATPVVAANLLVFAAAGWALLVGNGAPSRPTLNSHLPSSNSQNPIV